MGIFLSKDEKVQGIKDQIERLRIECLFGLHPNPPKGELKLRKLKLKLEQLQQQEQGV